MKSHRGTETQRRCRRSSTPLCLCVSVVLCICFSVIGCRNFGTGGTGELVVRQRVLREIDAVEISQFAVPAPPLATQPSTQALTQPSTRPTPPEERRILIEDVRRLALRNNLDL